MVRRLGQATELRRGDRWCIFYGARTLFRRRGPLFFLEARIVGDALGILKIQTEAGSVSVGHAFH